MTASADSPVVDHPEYSKSAQMEKHPLTTEPTASEPLVPPAPPVHSGGGPVRMNSGSKLRGLLFNVVIPLAVLSVGFGVVAALGSIEPKARVLDDETREGRLRRLPAAEVMKVLSLDEIGKPLELRVDGVVVPYREVAIAAEVSGRIIRKSPQCQTGQFVTEGQFLVEIDPTDYEQERDRLTRMREQEYEALKEVDQEIINAKRLVQIAADDVNLQERELKRLESMPAGFASQGEVDRAKKALLTAVQAQVSFENQLNLLAARRGKLEAAERLATTQLRAAEINLERTKIYSPVDGVIVQENAELNSFVQRGSPIATLNDVSKAEVAVNLRMDQLHWVLDQDRSIPKGPGDLFSAGLELNEPVATDQVSPGYSLPPTPAVIEYEVAGRGDTVYRWEGVLMRYDGIGLDPRSRTVPVVILVEDPQKFQGGRGDRNGVSTPSPLVRGMYVSVRLLIRPQTPLVAIPAVGIQPGNRVWQFVPDDSVLISSSDPPDRENASPMASAETASSPSEASSNTASSNANLMSVADDFDPAAWQPGRVFVRKKVVPVDSLWLSENENTAMSRGRSTGRGSKGSDRRYWICEIAGGEVEGGDWVVTSPLGEFDSELPVRVPVSELK
jgi:multidrug efflux pump subunit AcrA (membrane-fusion protein)